MDRSEIERLDTVVRSIWGVQADGQHHALPGFIAPDSHVEFVFHAGAPWHMKSVLESGWVLQSTAFVYAQRRGCVEFETTAHGSLVAFRVSPIVAATILRQPLTGLWDRIVPLEELIGPEARRIAEQLALADAADRFRLLRAWIAQRLGDWDSEQSRLQRLFDAVFWRHAANSLSQTCASLGPSLRTLRRWFAATAGVSPKEVQLGGRMLLACALLRERPGVDLATVALETGFFDHAAFAHAFTERVGLTPSRFRAEPTIYYERARPRDRC